MDSPVFSWILGLEQMLEIPVTTANPIQEPVLQFYTSLLVERLRERVAVSGDIGQEFIINIVDWFHWFAFDLVGELSFRESFGCLNYARHHPWINMIFSSIKGMFRCVINIIAR